MKACRGIVALSMAVVASCLVSVTGPLPHASATDPVIGWAWAQQFAPSSNESGGANAVDAEGNVYVVGTTDGTLPGSPDVNAGGDDAFLAKFDPSGTQLWVRQLGSNFGDTADDVAVESSGSIYVTGSTTGTLPDAPETNPGAGFTSDMFLAKFDAGGTMLWVHQSGTSAPESGQSVAIDPSGNAVVAGTDSLVVRFPSLVCCDNVLVAKFDTTGAKLWTQEISSSVNEGVDAAGGVAVDGMGDVYVSGTADGPIAGSPEPDAGAFVEKLDPDGSNLWVHALPGTATGGQVTVDAAGNAYVTGSTTADNVLPSLDPPAGGNDGFVSAYDASGSRQWVHRFGSSANDAGASVALNRSGVYATGYVAGQASGAAESFEGNHDVVLLKYSAAGDALFIHQYGGPGNEDPSGVSTDASGNVYVSGTADGHVPRAHPASFGTGDAFLSKYGVLVPTEPGPPENATAQPETASLAVSFVAPSDDGGVPASDYAVSCASPTGGVSGSASGSSSPITVSPLTNGKTYQCSVTATNTVGSGPASALTFNAKPATTKSIIAGGAHACAQKHEGQVLCWGLNSSGELGDGTLATHTTPVPVSGLASPSVLAAGAKHSCALLSTGRVQCWGDNSLGQIGDGTNTNRLTPTPVFGLVDAVAISSSKNHTCVARSNGTVRCWGANVHGQLGDNTTTVRTKPVIVSGIANATAVAAGTDHSCALLADTTVRCWGSNTYGQLGDGTLVERHTPVAVVGLSGVTAIRALGQSTCAVVTGGGVRCWGLNDSGQLGDGTTTNRSAPVAVLGMFNVSSLAGGLYHACAMRPNGTMKCWGDNSFGQIGDGTFTDRPTPVDVPVTNVATITAGANDSFARLQSGAVIAWGANAAGQLGDGMTATANPMPHAMPAFG